MYSRFVPSQANFVGSLQSRDKCLTPAGDKKRLLVTDKLNFSAVKDALIGDGLVPLRSTLSQHDEAPRCLNFEAENQWTACGTSPMALLSRPEVGAQMLKWLR